MSFAPRRPIPNPLCSLGNRLHYLILRHDRLRPSDSVVIGQKSVQAAIAAIEVYNKPNFSYREEAFALLMANAWELLLKAKWVLDHAEAIESIYELIDDGAGNKTAKTNRSGNPLTYGTPYLAAKLVEDKNSGFEQGCHDNIIALLEIRDNAAH